MVKVRMFARVNGSSDTRRKRQCGWLLWAALALMSSANFARAEPEDFDPTTLPYFPTRVEVPDCGGLTFEPSKAWERSVGRTVDGKIKHNYEVNAALLARSETGLSKIFVDPMVFLSVVCVPHYPYKGAAPDAERIVKRQKDFVKGMVESRLGQGRVSHRTKIKSMNLPGTISALIYFQHGEKVRTTTGYLDIQTQSRSILVLFSIPTPDKPRKRLPAGTVVSEPDEEGVIVSGRLTSEGGISAQGAYVPTRSFEDDISDIMRVFRSFRG